MRGWASSRRGGLVLGRRPVVPAGGAVGLGQVVPVGPDGRLQRAGVANQFGRVVELPGRVGHEPEQVPCVGVRRVGGEDLAVEDLGLVQPPGPVVLDGRLHQVVEVRVGHGV